MTRKVTRFRESELGLECRCSRCGEYWPADEEFFYMLRGKPHCYCKACYIEHRHATDPNYRRGYGKGPLHRQNASAAHG